MSNRGRISTLGATTIFFTVYLSLVGACYLSYKLFFSSKLAQARDRQVSISIRNYQTQIYDALKNNDATTAATLSGTMTNKSFSRAEKALSLFVAGEVALSQNQCGQANNLLYQAFDKDEKLKSLKNIENVYLGLSGCALIDGNNQEALTRAKEAINLNNTNAQGYYLAGIAYLRLNDKDQALINLQKAYDLEPTNTQYKKELEYHSNNQSNSKSAAQKQSTLGYTLQDVDYLVRDLKQIDSDEVQIKEFATKSSYNQAVISEIITLLARRRYLIEQLLKKMGNNLPLVESDFSLWNEYVVSTNRQNDLVDKMHNGKGGY